MLAMRADARSTPSAHCDDAGFALSCRPVMTRREAEVLFEIDATQSGENPGWTGYFVENLTEFLVFGDRPTGHISERDAAWLVACVGANVSGSVPALLHALVLQAEVVPQNLVAMALRCGAMRR